MENRVIKHSFTKNKTLPCGQHLDKNSECDSSIEAIHVSCRDCVFAQWKDVEGRNTQVGCKFDRLSTFSDTGHLLDGMDADSDFFIVSGRYCNAHRTTLPAEMNSNKFKKQVREEIRTKVDILIYVNPEASEEAAMEQLSNSLSDVQMQAINPSQVVVVNNHTQLFAPSITSLLRSSLTGIPYRLEHMVADCSFHEAISTAARRVVGQFFTVFHAGVHIPATFVSDIDFFINESLGRFTALMGDDRFNGATIQTGVFNSTQVTGNNTLTLHHEDGETLVLDNAWSKLELFAEINDFSHMILKVGDVCPSLKAHA